MNSGSKNFVLFQPGLSEGLIDNVSSKLEVGQILPASMAMFPAGAEFVELIPFDKNNYQNNLNKLKGANVTVIQSTGAPCAQNLIFALEAIDDAKRYGAKTVNAIFPYAEYMRQDRPDKDRFSSVANDLIPKMLAAAGLDHVTLITPHSQAGMDQYEKVFGRNVSYITATDIMAENLKAKFKDNLHELMIGAPDGLDKPGDQGHLRAIEIAKAIFGEENYKDHVFGIEKGRKGPGQSEVKRFEGDVAEKICVVIDDMIDTGGTMIKAAEKLKEKGAKEIHEAAIHGLFTNGLAPFLAARDNFDVPLIKSVIISNTLPVESDIRDVKFQFPNAKDRVHVVDISDLILKELKHLVTNSKTIERFAKDISRISDQLQRQ